MKPVFCGNFEYDARQSEIERLFSKYGRVEKECLGTSTGCATLFLPVPEFMLLHFRRANLMYKSQWHLIHMSTFSMTPCLSFSMTLSQSLNPNIFSIPIWQTGWRMDGEGFAFVYMDDERDAEDAIRGLDGREFGKKLRRLRVEWMKQERGGRRSVSSRRSSANLRPSKTLFVIKFDPVNTRTRDLERHFEPHGKVRNVRIRKNFAFIHFESQEDATKALEATNMSKLLDRVISVEYAVRDDDDERRSRYSPDWKGRDYPPERRGRNRGRSGSPYGGGHERGSPDYGRGLSPCNRSEQSPIYDRYRSRSPTRRE